MDDLAEAERQVAHHVHGGDDLEDGQLRHRRERMGHERQSGRTCPSPLHANGFEIIFDELANARASVRRAE
jgi:hypothetical protein